jgi:chitin synthase
MARGNRSSTIDGDDHNLVQLLVNSANPATVTQALKNCHAKDQPYADCGTNALVVVNPGRVLALMHDEYAKKYAKEYKDINQQTTETSPLPPHVFSLASKAYLHLRRLGQDQAIIMR